MTKLTSMQMMADEGRSDFYVQFQLTNWNPLGEHELGTS